MKPSMTPSNPKDKASQILLDLGIPNQVFLGMRSLEPGVRHDCDTGTKVHAHEHGAHRGTHISGKAQPNTSQDAKWPQHQNLPRAAIKALQSQAIALFRGICFFDPTDIRERYHSHDILSWAQGFRACSTSMQSKQLFDRLQPLQQWLFWMPVMLVKANDMGSSAMILLAQLHQLAMAIDSSILELSGAALGALTIHATQQVDARM
ncbi:hypothetical protein JMJ35_000014 [Cladonia borealis]|uniref:Uncharacterized protein n=1 Tax=Cladonia borealis TaxID=184061 RepID=A0AA39RAH6_9LECA|nr:hypothetical protein JMJ35_000014 [Cladonia borealis]